MQIKILKDRPTMFGVGAMTNGGIVLHCSMFAMGMYKPFKIFGGAECIVGPLKRKFGGPVPLVSTGSGPHATAPINVVLIGGAQGHSYN